MEIFETRTRCERRARPTNGPLNEARARLQRDVRILAHEIGERHHGRPRALEAAAVHMERAFVRAGLIACRQTYAVAGTPVANVVAEIRGRAMPDEIIVIGAPYDCPRGTPGANSHASSASALLELVRRLSTRPLARTLRFVAFATSRRSLVHRTPLGSRIHAQLCRRHGDDVKAMISLGSLGSFRPAGPAGTSETPAFAKVHRLVRPEDRKPVTLIGNLASRGILAVAHNAFARASSFPARAFVLPGAMPFVRSSAQASFWQEGFDGLMVTDAAALRPSAHQTTGDTPEKLDYGAMAAVVAGLDGLVAELGGALLLDNFLL